MCKLLLFKYRLSVPTVKYAGACSARPYTANPYTGLLTGASGKLETLLRVIRGFPHFVVVSVFKNQKKQH